ncbi:Dihydroorotate dehydrogenase (quinone), mitochondrial, partial [Quaeritorhiza haematococci]
LWGLDISNPLGLAAGFDKHAEAIDSMFNLGFGLVEIGSVTPLPQPGNPQPRMFRLSADRAVINRYGFNSEGHQSVRDRLKSRIRRFLHRTSSWGTVQQHTSGKTLPEGTPLSLHPHRLLGVNLGKNKVSAAESNEDYVRGVETLGPFADYVVVNISSPNTPGLRSLQRREPMEKLMAEVKQARDKHLTHKPPLLVKIAPDVSDEELEDIAAVVKSVGVDGVIISNTTISRPVELKSDRRLQREAGGLSGPPLLSLSLATLRKFYALTQGTIPLIGCGGIASGEDAIRFAKAGASLVQFYTGMAYEGPTIVTRVKGEIKEALRKEGKSWGQIVGEDHRGSK